MSLALKVFSENFLKGLQLGQHWADKQEDREVKRQTLKYQLAKMEQDAAMKRQTLAETARRNTAYITQSGAYADYLRKKAGAIGAKGAGAGGPDANVQAFLLDPRVNEPGLATPPPAPTAGGGGSSSDDGMPTPPTPPPANESGGSGGGDDSDTTLYQARGGRVPRVKKFSMGGTTGLGGLIGGMGGGASAGGMGGMGDMGGGGMGFNPMSYISDFANIGTEIGGGDQGETESPQTPYDPMASMWEGVSGHPREKYDEGERIGSSVGRPIGRAIGDYFTGGIGSGAFAEAGGRFGGGAGAAFQGHFGEAANDLTQGTPLSLIHFQGGGTVPRTALDTSPASRMKYQVRRAQAGARPPPVPRQNSMRPSAGTSGPGSGFGEVAAPPVTYTPRYASGGRVDPSEAMWNSFYDNGGEVRDSDSRERSGNEPMLRPEATPGMASIPIGKNGRARLGATYDPSSRYGAVEGGYEHDISPRTTLGIRGHVGKDLGPEGAGTKADWGVGVRGRIKFAEGGTVERNETADPRYARPMTEEEQRIRVENPDAGRGDVPYERGGERPRSDRTFRNPPSRSLIESRWWQGSEATKTR